MTQQNIVAEIQAAIDKLHKLKLRFQLGDKPELPPLVCVENVQQLTQDYLNDKLNPDQVHDILVCCIENGYIDVFKYVYRAYPYNVKHLSYLNYSASHGQMEILKYIIAENEVFVLCADRYKVVLTEAIQNGHDDIAIYLLKDHCPRMINYVAYLCARFGRLELFQYLQQFALSHDKMKYFRKAAKYGHLEFLKFLVDVYSITKEELLKHLDYRHDANIIGCSATNGHFEVVKYILEKFDISKDDIQPKLDNILRCASGHWGMVRYLLDQYMD